MNQQQQGAAQHEHEGHSSQWVGFTSLEFERRTHVDTACAAYHLGRKPQTLRVWHLPRRGLCGQFVSMVDWLGR